MRCYTCGIEKPEHEMQINRSRASGYSGYCKVCSAAVSREWAHTHPEKVREMKRAYVARNRDTINAYRRQYVRDTLRQNRERALKMLGGKCRICGFADSRALEIDHMNGGGKSDRKARGPRERYAAIAKGQTAGFQALCANCHTIKTYRS